MIRAILALLLIQAAVQFTWVSRPSPEEREGDLIWMSLVIVEEKVKVRSVGKDGRREKAKRSEERQ